MKGDTEVKVKIVNNHRSGKQWVTLWEGSSQRVQLTGYSDVEAAKVFMTEQAKLFVANSIDKDGIEDNKR
eukprot:2689697-Pyramimonas_sp.AAC.1